MEILVLTLIAVGVVLAVRHMIKHKPSCGGNCAGCTMDCKKRQ